MSVRNFITCVLFTSFVSFLVIACNNADMTTEETDSKKDTMAANTYQKEPQLTTTVKSAGINLFVNDGGAGNTPVLFVHSFGGSSLQWKNQLEYLRPGRRAIAFDLRGHGQSGAPSNNDYSVEALAKDISAVADSLGLDRFVLVGHSIGSSAAIAYAGRHPNKVAGLVITGTPGKTPAEQAKPIITSLESEKYDTVMEQYMKQLLTNAKPATEKLEREGMTRISKEASLNIIKAAFKYNPLPDLHKYPGPELIISGSGEENLNSLHNTFPTIPYKTVEGTSHWIQLDKPDEFNRLLNEFLQRIEKK